jgi:hypothetical protein
VLGVFAACVFDPEVVDDECEGDRTGGVAPEAGGEGDRTIAMGFQEFDKAVVRQYASLR